jgi:hypothetical protein
MTNYLQSLGIKSSGGGKSKKGRLPKIPKGLKKAVRKKKAKEVHKKKVAARVADINAMKRYVGRL